MTLRKPIHIFHAVEPEREQITRIAADRNRSSEAGPDKTIVEFKLASNTHLRQNLVSQVELYKKASTAQADLKVIFCFTSEERVRVQQVLDELRLAQDRNVVLVNASPRSSASKT